MKKNQVKSALKFLKKNKLFTFVNILGLSLALCTSFIILLYVINEISYDSCHKNRSQIFRVNTQTKGYDFKMSSTPFILASALKNEFPQITKATQTADVRDFKIKNKDEFVSIDGCTASSSELLDMFTIPVTPSNGAQKQLNDKRDILLSQSLANKLFGTQNSINQIITCLINDKEEELTITGIYKDIPENSTFHPACLINTFWKLEDINKGYNITDAETNWKAESWKTWVMLENKDEEHLISKSFPSFIHKYRGESTEETYSLQCLNDVYLHSQNISDSTAKGNLKNIHMFLFIAFVIIILATLNYILLSTTISGSRTKEIGIRKTNGASIKNLRFQLLNESIVLALLSIPVSLLFLFFVLPAASKLFDTELIFMEQNLPFYFIVLLGIPLLTGILSGFYSAYYLSGLKVISILKPSHSIVVGKTYFRTAIIAAELIIFCGFLSSTLIIKSQHRYCLTNDPGYKTEDRLFVHTGSRFNNFQAYKNAISNSPLIINAAGSMENFPTTGSSSFPASNYKNPAIKVKVEVVGVNYGFIETMGIEVKEGRSFSESYQTDRKESVILNEAAVKQLEITDPLGKAFDDFPHIIGIVKDFKLHGFYNDIPPVCIVLAPEAYNRQMAIHYQHGKLNETLALLKEEWKKLQIDKPFEYSTVADSTRELYQKEENLTTIVSLATLFAFIISILGIFGLTLYIAKARTKEIGIRKVLGSSHQSIIYSFLKNNLIAVVISGIIATPLSYYFMNQWLSNFSYHITISPVFYAIAILAALFIVSLTVIFQSYFAANKNPVEALKYE